MMPPICCSLMEAKFCKVRPWSLRPSTSCCTRMPAWTLTVLRCLSTSKIPSMRAKFTIPVLERPIPFGESPDPTGRIRLRASLSSRSSCSAFSGWRKLRVCTSWVPLQLETVCRSSGSGAYRKICAFLCLASSGRGNV